MVTFIRISAFPASFWIFLPIPYLDSSADSFLEIISQAIGATSLPVVWN